jgi:hypothetical protein
MTQNNHTRRKPPGALKPIKPPEGIWQLLTMDFHGPITPTTKQGNKYITVHLNWFPPCVFPLLHQFNSLFF